LCGQLATECVGRNVVDERLDAADLDHRDQLPKARFELRVARDVHLAEVEAELVTELVQDRACALAQVAPGRVVEDDGFRYG
jgi:hypothetical protein